MKIGAVLAIISGIVYLIYSLLNRKKILIIDLEKSNIIEKELFFKFQLYFSLLFSCLSVLYGLIMFKFNVYDSLFFILIFINRIVYKLFAFLCKQKGWIKLTYLSTP